MSTSGWLDRQNMVYLYNGILFSLKSKQSQTQAIGRVILDDPMLSEISQSQKDKYYMIQVIWGT